MSWTGLKKKKQEFQSGEEETGDELVERENSRISIRRQCELLGVNRSDVYREPAAPKLLSDEELRIRQLIDRVHTDEPTWGYRSITSWLRNWKGIIINRKRTRRIMRDMGIYAIYPKPNLSKMYLSQYRKPYLLRNYAITRANQVWGVDITYIPMPKGFMYLFVILDWYSRYIVDYELSSTLDKSFVLNCMKRALKRHKPEIINSDQGGHFTNADYVYLVEQSGARVSMNGRGQCLDNVRTERFFRSYKYERIYINEITSPRELRQITKEYIHHYNYNRPHASLDGFSPSGFFPVENLIYVA
jgi:putative transposase